ncbi:MAG: hypothetical protein HZB99_01945 [Candidatus Harrisonbacteria bacterium]|nr:hypothetical protein [Candidatus Harrisonbacteria bacterium]
MKILLASLFIGNVSANPYVINSDTATYLDLPFKSVNATGGSKCEIFFKEVTVDERLKDVSVDIDSVTVKLITSTSSYTTIDVYDSFEDIYQWIKPERVVVVVRSKEDLKIWDNYLNKLRKKRDDWRRYMNSPTRVFPPKDLSP